MGHVHGRLIAFDLDGTLIDSSRDLAESVNELLTDLGAPPLPPDDITRMIGEGAKVLVRRALAAAGIPEDPEAIDRFLEIYDRKLLNHTRPYPGIPEVLEALGLRSPLAVLTNKPLASTRRILAGLGLARHFPDNAVVGGDGPFPRKPDPAGLLHLMARARVDAAATLLVGDSIVDWRTARAAATPICLARYGFGYEGFPRDAIAASDRLIDAPADLLAL